MLRLGPSQGITGVRSAKRFPRPTRSEQGSNMPTKKIKKAAAPKAVVKPSHKSAELTLISDLASILNSTGLSEIELEQKGVRIRVAKSVMVSAAVPAPAPVYHAAPAPAPIAVAAPVAAIPVSDNPGTVKSPMVGTVYMSSAPDAAPFVTVGSTVKEGQTVLIIEAMKTMNQIPAPRAGKVTQIIVNNGSPVEYGEALLVIE
jgi:acetyl-CoA carboxylase biotin carboxyl carrier protein